MTVANDVHERRKHLLERFGRLVCLVLLPVAEAPVDDIHQPNCHTKLGHTGNEGNDAGDPEQYGHKVREV